MSVPKTPKVAITALTLALMFTETWAEDKTPGPAATPAPAAQPARPVDRDGKPIYGAEIMTEQELGGYRSLMHFTKTLEERDALRAEYRKNMEKRAKERGIKLAD